MAARAAVGVDKDHGVRDTELIFNVAGETARCEPLAACWNTGFEDVLPVRALRSRHGQQHWPGLWWAVTTGRHVGYESWLERDLIRTLRRVIRARLLPAGADGAYRLIDLAPASVRACRATLEPHRSMNPAGGAATAA